MGLTHGRGWHDDEMWTLVPHFFEVREEGDGLDRLAEAHLVGQDAVQGLLVHQDQPVQPWVNARKESECLF